MNKEKLNTLLDSIYELEGLVHLAITRDDEPAMLPELIRRKSRELMAHAEKATAVEESEPEMQTNAAIDNEALEDNSPEDEVSMQDNSPEDEVPMQDNSPQEYVEDLVESEGVAGIPVSPEPEEEESIVLEEEEERVMPQSEVLSIFNSSSESEAESEPISKPKPQKFQEYTEPRGRLVFSINDRYRFKRELFHGSDNDFNTTLSRVASMEGYDEAEDYFLNDLQWDEKSPDVIDFLEILKNYFK